LAGFKIDFMIKKWKKISEVPYNTEYRKMSKVKYLMPDGKTKNYDVIQGKNIAAIVAFTLENKIILVKQYRPGPHKILLELPAGVIEPKENPKKAVARELLEETGYKGNIKFVGTSLMGGYNKSIRYSYVATDCVKVAEPTPDEYEYVEPVVVNLDQFCKQLRAGRLTDVATGYLVLDYLKLL
jgi:ADP-ribose pyrophosphatase